MTDSGEGIGAPWWNEGAFLYVGRLAANKGVVEILTAWLALGRRLGDRCPDLWIAGGAPSEIAAIRDQLGDSALERQERRGRLRWWGYLDEAGLSALLLKARVLLMHSVYEPGGRVVLEAMAEGVPVIATSHGFACDLVRDWTNGFIVPNGDLALLRRRMEHFALQPFLGPSLGMAASATARAALDSWAFYRTHGQVYAQIASGADPGPLAAPGTDPDVIRDPLPRGLAGRYPFAAALPDRRHVQLCAARLLGVDPALCEVRDLPASDGALHWAVEAGARYHMVHLPSVYLRRPLWDRSDRGPLFTSGPERRRRRAAAAALPGFRPLLVDETAGLHLAPEGVRGVADGPSLEKILKPLRALWTHAIAAEAAAAIRSEAADWWSRRERCPWRSDPAGASILRQASLRVAWTETEDKLRRGDISCGPSVRRAFAAADFASAVAADEDRRVPFCWQHGDPRPTRLCVGPDGPSLSGGEDAAVGWWGRDAALAMLRFGDAAAEDWRRHCLERTCADPDQIPILLLRAAVEAALALAEAMATDGEAPLGPGGVCELLAAAERRASR